MYLYNITMIRLKHACFRSYAKWRYYLRRSYDGASCEKALAFSNLFPPRFHLFSPNSSSTGWQQTGKPSVKGRENVSTHEHTLALCQRMVEDKMRAADWSWRKKDKKERRTSWSRYQLQICMFPPLSSMHLVNCVAAPAQLLDWSNVCWVLTGAADCSAGAELPPNMLPTAFATVDPMATPLQRDKFVSLGVFAFPSSVPYPLGPLSLSISQDSSFVPSGWGRLGGGFSQGKSYAAVEATWPRRPEPADCAGAAAGGAAAADWGAAIVVAGRFWAGAEVLAGAVGREGARMPDERPPPPLRRAIFV